MHYLLIFYYKVFTKKTPNVMWNTLSDVYVCGSTVCERMSYGMYYTCIIDKKVKKCFTDQNMLNTVNTKSSHSILSFNKSFRLLLLIKHDNETGGRTKAQSNCDICIKQHERHAASVWLQWVSKQQDD